MQPLLKSVLDFGFEAALEVLNLGFSDYLIPIHLDIQGFHQMVRVDGIDLALSQVVIRDGKGVGVALIAHRGWSSRLAGMAIIPGARGKQTGRWMMDRLVCAAKERGDHRMELEVIIGNDPAVHLYESTGFRTIRKLVSYKAHHPDSIPANLNVIDIREVARKVAAYAFPKLPWQLSFESLVQAGYPNLAYHLDSAWAVISSPQSENIYLRSLVVRPDARNQGRATHLLQALFARYTGKTWHIPAIFPEEMSRLFEAVGFEKQALSQFQMELNLFKEKAN
jgi:GNAT superfamily N-acetyltransferase